ncbi:hypothetical protein DL96DRAFT_1820963 [Flagelloscypha sp. PMI_526]|nr:hypothetical protein DL96DRAFT_1820963 [Flagelloscypha sp. PMI_526]
MITFYDIPSTLPGVDYGPNTPKVRLALEYKGIPFETKWVEFPDISKVSIEVGAQPTGKWKHDGSPLYTCPFIYDSKTGKAVSDSWNIVQYLDETYPDTPRLVPQGLNGLVKVFIDEAGSKLLPAFAPYNLSKTGEVLNPASQPFFFETRSSLIGITLAELDARANWDTVKASLDWLEGVIEQNKKGGQYIVGDQLTYADIFVGSLMRWFVVHGKESQLWKDLVTLNGGRWGKLLEELEVLGKFDQLRLA